ncbi:gamma-glutamylcyclotransferase-like isoform X1 [Pectinophora gossypiella]|uniref:gamma-glutamylcyclotransferase-like isoform X1 n=1 Tax=Pectinophora gossypiella TaxID=13191 RepID=UPI00214E06A8|nr:gamma-glutamylcyclotransferase-like isoform X1 [Pectinophora gossypiella]
MHLNNRVLVWATFAHVFFFAGGFATNNSSASNDVNFYYFAYGSNLYDKRIHVNNPSAVFYSVAVLRDYRLDFNMSSKLWRGAPATICNDPGGSVWGALWVIQQSDRKHLDNQENIYYPTFVPVTTIDGKKLQALVYIQYYQPKKLPSWKDLPMERRPSITYINVMITGAVKVGLPLQYNKMLCTIPHNNQHADPIILKQLGKPFSDYIE